MSKLNELIQFADYLGQGRKEERRYQNQQAIQMAQIGEKKLMERKVVQSQQFLNNAVKSFSQSGWQEDENGNLIYSNEGPNKEEVMGKYLSEMDSIGQAGDRFMLGQNLGQVNSQNIANDARKLQGVMATWDAKPENVESKNAFFGNKYENDRKAYLESINASGLYRKMQGLEGGAAKAMELTGLAPDSFNEKPDSWLQFAKDNKMVTGLSGAGTVATGALAYKGISSAITSMGESIARGEELITSKGKGKELVAKLTKDLEKLKLGGSAADAKHAAKLEKFLAMVTKRGYIDNASRISLSKVASNFPGGEAVKTGKVALDAAEKALKGLGDPTTTSNVLRFMKKIPKLGATLGIGIAGYQIARKLTSGLTDVAVGEKDSTAGKIAGVAGGSAGALGTAAAVKAAFKTIGDNISKKGTRWALTRVMKRGGPALAAKFILKAGLGGIAAPTTSGIGTVGAAIWIASDAFEIAKILSEDE